MSIIDISTVIPVYNRCDELRMTLQSLARQTLPVECFEVIIADDGSAEDVQSVLKEFSSLQIKYVYQSDEGFRVSAARNLGVSQSDGRIIVYNDNGIMLKSDALERHLAYHQSNDDGFVVLGNMFGTAYRADQEKMRHILDNHPPDEAIALMKEDGSMGDGRERNFASFGEDVSQWYLPWVGLWSGHFSVKAAFVKTHGVRWNEGFTTWGGEDAEYGLQLCKAGAKLCFCRDIEVVHYPTKGRMLDLSSPEFQANHKKMRHYILSLHPSRALEAYAELGGAVNMPEIRAEFFKKKGWTDLE
ncbi:MAG: glycosyltransferase [Defluviitaleaceae bacterium]|nr:glycosyltransferase [Defluviitaleaceae bacterium]